MKNVFVTIVFVIFSSQLFAQEAEKIFRKPVTIRTPNLASVSCPSGTYPNGKNCYPCLGCHPCGNTYCDNNSGAITIKISELVPLNLINEFEANGDISTKITKKDLMRLILENSTKDNMGNNQKTRVKCGCGTDIYGKDAAACTRICDFLGSQVSIKH